MHSNRVAKRSWIIWLVLLLSLILQIIPWGAFSCYKPNFLLLVLIYWLLALPHRVGFITSFILGLILDLVSGATLGMHIFSLAVVTYLTLFKFQIVRNLALWQQALIVFCLSLINEIILFILAMMINYSVMMSNSILITSLINALLWPWIFLLLRKIRRVFWIQ